MKKPYMPKPIPVDELDWESLIPRIGMAQAAVARFDGILHAMVNPELLLSPLTTQEAVLSSRIEGTQASLEDVLQYDVAPRADAEHRDDIQEVQNYREAMTEAVEWLKASGLTLNVIQRIHKLLLAGVRGQEKTPGRIRKVQNHIGAISEKNEWQGWVEFFLTAVSQQAERNTRRAGAILRLYNEMKEDVNRITHSQFTLQTLDALFFRPFLTAPDFVKRTGLARRTGFRIAEDLQKNRILEVHKAGAGRRPAVLSFKRLIEITEQKSF